MQNIKNGLVIIALLVITACGGSGGGSSDSSSSKSSADTSITTLIYSDSNVRIGDSSDYLLGMMLNPDNGESVGLIGNLDENSSVSDLKAVTYQDPDGNRGYMEFDLNGLPASIKGSDGSRIEYSNYGDSTVDITFFGSNGAVIYGPVAVEISNEDVARLKSLYPIANLAFKEGVKYGRLSNSAKAKIWEYASVALGIGGCAVSIGVVAATTSALGPLGLLATVPLATASCSSMVLSIAAAYTDNPDIDYVSTTLGKGLCSLAPVEPSAFLSCAGLGAGWMAQYYNNLGDNGGGNGSIENDPLPWSYGGSCTFTASGKVTFGNRGSYNCSAKTSMQISLNEDGSVSGTGSSWMVTVSGDRKGNVTSCHIKTSDPAYPGGSHSNGSLNISYGFVPGFGEVSLNGSYDANTANVNDSIHSVEVGNNLSGSMNFSCALSRQ